MSIREHIQAFKLTHAGQSPTAPARMMLSDHDAVALVTEAEPGELRHAELAATVADSLGKHLEARPDPDETDAFEDWFVTKRSLSALMWEALEGQVIDGVEIIRRRAP